MNRIAPLLVVATSILLVGCDDDVTAPEWSYFNDFESSAGSEWSSQSVGTSPSGERFLGTFNVQPVVLTLADLPDHDELTVELDFYVVDDWNGNNGPDAVSFTAQNALLLRTSFSNTDGDEQAYPGSYPASANAPLTGAVATETLGYQGASEEGVAADDATYRLSFDIPHDGGSFSFAISGSPTGDDERWGVDNVRVTAR